MRWSREGSGGAYTAGPYRVERPEGEMWWRVTGPDGVDARRTTKRAAQDLAYEYASARVHGEGRHTATPVVGDWAYEGGYCRITAVLDGPNGRPTYVLLTSRGKRLCRARVEVTLVVR